MPSSEELQKQNVASVARQRLRREFRSASKMLDKAGAGEEAQDRLRESFEKKKGQVYDTALNYKPSDNNEGISTATNDTFGNDFFSFDPEAGGGGGGGGVPNGYEETDVILCQNGSPVSGQILFKPDE